MDIVQKSFIILTLVASIFLTSTANADTSKTPTFAAKVGDLKKITFKITNYTGKEQGFVNIIQVKNPDDTVDQLSWIMGVLQTDQEFRPQQSWIPEKPGEYTVDVFVWGSLDNPTPLSPFLTMKVIVEE